MSDADVVRLIDRFADARVILNGEDETYPLGL